MRAAIIIAIAALTATANAGNPALLREALLREAWARRGVVGDPLPVPFSLFEFNDGTNLVDASGNGNDGIWGGGTLPTNNWGEIVFKASNASTTTTNFPDGYNGRSGTFSCWCSPAYYNVNGSSVMQMRDVANNGIVSVQTISGGTNLVARIQQGGSIYYQAASYNAETTLGPSNYSWIAASWTTNGVELYIDGSLVASDYTLSGTITYTNANNGSIGSFNNGRWQDRVAFYTNALSSNQIQRLWLSQPHSNYGRSP